MSNELNKNTVNNWQIIFVLFLIILSMIVTFDRVVNGGVIGLEYTKKVDNVLKCAVNHLDNIEKNQDNYCNDDDNLYITVINEKIRDNKKQPKEISDKDNKEYINNIIMVIKKDLNNEGLRIGTLKNLQKAIGEKRYERVLDEKNDKEFKEKMEAIDEKYQKEIEKSILDNKEEKEILKEMSKVLNKY